MDTVTLTIELLEEISETLLSWITDEFDVDNDDPRMAQYLPPNTAAHALANALDRKHKRCLPVEVDRQHLAPVPAGSRQGDPLESDLAAASVKAETTVQVKQAIAETLTHTIARGLTDEELVRRVERKVQATPQRIRTARSEMVRSGLVTRVGIGRTSRGRQAALWALTAYGHRK